METLLFAEYNGPSRSCRDIKGTTHRLTGCEHGGAGNTTQHNLRQTCRETPNLEHSSLRSKYQPGEMFLNSLLHTLGLVKSSPEGPTTQVPKDSDVQTKVTT